MTAFLFPGQGSQKRGMGQDLFDVVREYAVLEKDIDALLGYSLRKLCLEDKDNLLKETQYTQPSLYVINALYYFKAKTAGETPSYLAGHSLGEYNALLAAGCFDFLTGLRLVKKRGELMSRARNGGMAAVVGLDSRKIATIVQSEGLTSIDIANFNSPSQIVLSGPVEAINRAGPIFEKAGARLFMPLPVSAAFHSRYMADAARAFSDFLSPMVFLAPKTPVIANVTAAPYPIENASDALKSLLVRQITSPVQWVDTIRYMASKGNSQFKETGPGAVLTRLVQQIQSEA